MWYSPLRVFTCVHVCRQAVDMVRVTFATLAPNRGWRHFTFAKLNEKSSNIADSLCIPCICSSSAQICSNSNKSAYLFGFSGSDPPGCLLGVSSVPLGVLRRLLAFWVPTGCLLGAPGSFWVPPGVSWDCVPDLPRCFQMPAKRTRCLWGEGGGIREDLG